MSECEPQPEINEVQELQLKLMEATCRDAFEGKQVVEDLRRFRPLWRAAMMVRDPSFAPLLPLRDLEDGIWNADTLMILPSGKDDEKLELLARTWEAGDVSWIEGKEADDLLGGWTDKPRILQVWWD